MRFLRPTTMMIAIVALCAGPAVSMLQAGPDVSDLEHLKSIWNRLSPEQRQQYRDLVARTFGNDLVPRTPGDTCDDATYETGDLPFATTGDTTDETDTLNLDEDGACAGGGNQFAGTGTGPELVYLLEVDVSCTVSVTMTPGSTADLSLYVVRDCTDLPTTCEGVSDAGGAGVAENVTFTAQPGVDYFVVVDGWADVHGPFDLQIDEAGGTGCSLVPVELQGFDVD